MGDKGEQTSKGAKGIAGEIMKEISKRFEEVESKGSDEMEKYFREAGVATRCPSSEHLGHSLAIPKGGSGSFWFGFTPRLAGAASGTSGWSFP